MQKKWIILNVIISIFLFWYIFKSFAGRSGGDIAIIAGNIMFGIAQIILNLFFLRKYKNTAMIIASIVLIQIIELIVFIKWGYEINNMLR